MDAPPTDPSAAEQLPRNDIGRDEALNLAESVFGSAVEAPAGVWDELSGARILGDHTAVLPSGAMPAVGGEANAEEEAGPRSVLVESSLPLLSEVGNGIAEPIDLSLERNEGALQPVNPLVSAEVPTELGEGVSLANDSMHLAFGGVVPNRAPSVLDEDAAFYPNTAQDTDMVIAPTPTGVETFTQLRTAEAPRDQEVQLELPEDAALKGTAQGGAEAELNGRTLLRIPPPTAIDASGAQVPTTLSVSGDRIEMEVSPPADVSYPILADPEYLVESYNWTWGSSNFAGWQPSQTAGGYRALEYAYPNQSVKALGLSSGWEGGAAPNTGAQWYYDVPRYNSDNANYGEAPSTWLERVHLEGVEYLLEGSSGSEPVMVAGILDPYQNLWIAVGSHTGNEGEITGWSGNYEYPNYGNQHGKIFSFGLITRENEANTLVKYRTAIAAIATVTIADSDTPQVLSVNGPEGWWNTGEPTVSYAALDKGLGIYSLRVTPPGQSTYGYAVGCTGGSASPCPREEKSADSSNVKVPLKIASAPEGADTFTLGAVDPVSHVGTSPFRVNVDHSAPSLSLTGTMAEQAEFGTRLAQYKLKYSAADGAVEPPTLSQAGVNTVFSHPADIAVDPSGNRWVADENNNRIVKVNTNGEVAATYSALGSSDSLSRPTGIDTDSSGDIWVVDNSHNRIVEFKPNGEWWRKIGSLGNENGHFFNPDGIAVAPNGNVWVTDTGNNRIELFSSTGSFIRAFGGTGSGQLHEPSGIDVAPNGKAWVADTGNNRLEVFNESGEVTAAYGESGSGAGQLSKPSGLDVDARGSVWVIDGGNGRVEQFSERGEYLGKFGSAGTGENQFTFSAPSGITTSSAGVLFVTDSGGNRITRWNAPQGTRSGVRNVVVKVDGETVQEPSVTCPEGGCPLTGEWTLNTSEYAAGSHSVEVNATDGVGLTKTEKLNITLNPPAPTLTLSGTLTEQSALGKTRPRYLLQAEASPWGQTEGSGPPTFISAFGSTGSEPGQLNGPRGVAADGKGHVWVVDRLNNRVEEFSEAGEYLGKFGSAGTGNGQLSEPWGITVTAAGNLWVADTGNKRLEEFNAKGEFIQKFGTKASSGSKGTEFLAPEGIAVAPGGMLWVSDSAGHRLAEFRESPASEAERFVRNAAGVTLSEPISVAVDASGDVYTADQAANHVFEFSSEGGYLQTIGTAGSADGQLSGPTGVAIAPSGRIYVVDRGNNRVEAFGPGGEFAIKFGTTGTGNGNFTEPRAIAFGAGSAIFVTDKGNNRVHRWGATAETTPTFISAFGATGSEPGQLNGPRGVAADGKGHVWVVDRANNRVEEFNEAGEYLGKFGSAGTGNGQLSEPWGITVTATGNIWVADTGNKRLEEFNPKGEFVQTFGTKATSGSKGTEFLAPEGVAAAPGGMLWVSDPAGHRLAEFRESPASEAERFVRNAAGVTLSEPISVAVDASGDVYTADQAANHVFEFGLQGGYLQTIGAAGSADGQLSGPTGVAVAPSGRIYVVDRGNNRVEAFSPKGEYVTKFGTTGAGNGNFTEPRAIAYVAGSAIFVTDKGNNRVHRWQTPNAPDEIQSVEVLIDGKAVTTTSAGCVVGSCKVAKQFTLNGLEYLGSHKVTVIANSQGGFSKTKTLSITEQRDETKPTIQIGGELANAPEGWVQQESYGFTATGSDPAGYGDTALAFKIDGSQVASTTQSSPDGGCAAIISKGVSMAAYSGGAHQAEVIATDGAGNTATKRWTINVDPDGHISTQEAMDTLEAVEETAASIPLGGEPVGVEGKPPVTLEATGTGFAATGGSVPTGVSTSPGGAITVEIPTGRTLYGCPSEQEPIEGACPANTNTEEALIPVQITPLGTAEGASPSILFEENAAVSANTQVAADTTIRPLDDGGMVYAAIRDQMAPEKFSYKVTLGAEQELRQIDAKHIQAFYNTGQPSFLISAEPATDAVGTEVPTSLELSAANVVSLTVHHLAGHDGAPFVYPVVAGSGWEGGFHTTTVDMDNIPPEEQIVGEEGEAEVGELFVSAPEPVTDAEAEEAQADPGDPEPVTFNGPPSKPLGHFFRAIGCGTRFVVTDPTKPDFRDGTRCGNPFTREEGGEDTVFSFGVRGHFYVSYGDYVAHIATPYNGIECDKMLYSDHFGGWAESSHFIDPARQCQWMPKSGGNGGKLVTPIHHLTPYGEWRTGVGSSGSWDIQMKGLSVFIWATPGGYETKRKVGLLG